MEPCFNVPATTGSARCEAVVSVRHAPTAGHRKIPTEMREREGLMKLKLLSEVQQRDPSYAPSWSRTSGDVIAEDLRFGSLRHGVVCADDGSPAYDLPIWMEPFGAVSVTVTPDDRIALLKQYRPVPSSSSSPEPWPPGDLSSCGRLSWELPRGFPEPGETPDQTARREAEEELGWAVESVELLGNSNPNTTYCWNNQAVYLVRVDARRPVRAKRDKMEAIERVKVFTWQEVLQMTADGRIFCGFTQAALFALHARGGITPQASS